MDKFKNNLQQKFNQREIQPTDEAWGKITGELASSRARKTKSLWLWSGIAAGFIGLLVLLSPSFLSLSSSPAVVNSEENPPQVEGLQTQQVSFINQLQRQGIQQAEVEFAPAQLNVKAPRLKPRFNSNSTPTKANALLAEVEQELEAERYSQQNMDETEFLLAQARSKLSSKKDQKIFDQLSAQQLLAEIDLEDSNSFRDKIWKLIEVNFKELKTSLGAS